MLKSNSQSKIFSFWDTWKNTNDNMATFSIVLNNCYLLFISMKKSIFWGDDYTTWGSQMEMWGQFLFNLAIGSTFSAKVPTHLHSNLNENNRVLGNVRTFFTTQVAWNLSEICELNFVFDNCIFLKFSFIFDIFCLQSEPQSNQSQSHKTILLLQF